MMYRDPYITQIWWFQLLKLRFSEDLRVNEVRRLLQSSRPVRISLTQRPEVRWVVSCFPVLECLASRFMNIFCFGDK